MSSESSTVEFHGHNGHLILGLSVLDSPTDLEEDQISPRITSGHGYGYGYGSNAAIGGARGGGEEGENPAIALRNNSSHNSGSRRETSNRISVSQPVTSVSGGGALISAEESTFFSVGEDNHVICWDEYDRTERFSFRLKESSEVLYSPLLALASHFTSLFSLSLCLPWPRRVLSCVHRCVVVLVVV
jgi:hypothetical protein